MSYEQLAASVDALGAVNTDLKNTVLAVQAEAESARDAAQSSATQTYDLTVQAQQAALDAANSAVEARKVSRQYPFTFVTGTAQYDVGVISGDPSVNTTSLALWIEGVIDYNFSIDTAKKFTILNPEFYANGTQMRIIVNARFEDLTANFDDLQDVFISENSANYLDEKTGRTADYFTYLRGLQLEPAVAYGSGVNIVRPTQTVTQAGVLYRPASIALPFTTTNWTNDSSRFVVANDLSIRQDLADPAGAGKSGFDILQAYPPNTVGYELLKASVRGAYSKNFKVDYGATANNAANDTTALINFLSDTGSVFIPKGDYLLDGALLFSQTGVNAFNVQSNTQIICAPGVRFRITSNQLADGTRVELTGSNIIIENLELNEINATLSRSNVYGTLSGRGCSRVLLKNLVVDGANGAGVHFRNNSNNVTIHNPRIINTKSDGLHIQRGSSFFRITQPHFEANEDDCLGIVSHGRNEGYGPVSNIEVLGGYYGPQINGAVGSGIAVIGGRNVRIINPRCQSNGLSGVRVNDWVSAPEGSYASAGVFIDRPECYDSGQTTSVVAGLVKDGLTIFNARAVLVVNPDIRRPKVHGVSISGSGIDIKVLNPTVRDAGGRGLWVSASFSSAAHVLELTSMVADTRYPTVPASLGMEDMEISNTDISGSFSDGFIISAAAVNTVIRPILTKINVSRSNVGNAAGKFGIQIANTSGMRLDGVSGGVSASATSITPLQFSNAGYLYMNGIQETLISHSYPVSMSGGLRRFRNTTFPTSAPVAGGDYKVGETVENTAPAVAGYMGWVCVAASAGTGGTWGKYGLIAA